MATWVSTGCGSTDDRVRLSLLGPPHVEWHGSSVRGFESRKALTLLCYLAVTGQPVTRTRLADLFWVDKTERRGRANLSRVLHNICHLLPGVVRREPHVVCLHRDRVWTDLQTFTELEHTDDIACLERAVELYRGDFLSSVDGDKWGDLAAWLEYQREHWRRRVARMLHQLVDHHSRRRNSRLAMDYASRLLSLDPWSEEAHREMMRALVRDGQRSRALAQYHVCRRVLAEELGLAPSQATQAIYEQIKSLGERPPTNLACGPAPPTAVHRNGLRHGRI